MPPSLRDVRVVSPAVNLPRPLAAALLIAGCGFAEQHGLIPRARFRALAIAGRDPVAQFTAILDATRKALKSAGPASMTSACSSSMRASLAAR